MINCQEIQDALRALYAGKTQTEIAKKSGVSQSYIADLISGKSSAEKLSIEKINQLFPGAALSLGNRTIGSNNVFHSHARVQSDDIYLPAGDDVTQYRQRLIDTLIATEELSDEERGRVLRIIRSLK